jgi:hypothetical protein
MHLQLRLPGALHTHLAIVIHPELTVLEWPASAGRPEDATKRGRSVGIATEEEARAAIILGEL